MRIFYDIPERIPESDILEAFERVEGRYKCSVLLGYRRVYGGGRTSRTFFLHDWKTHDAGFLRLYECVKCGMWNARVGPKDRLGCHGYLLETYGDK